MARVSRVNRRPAAGFRRSRGMPVGGVLKIAVPPGVGDVYWALTKLRAFRDKYRARQVVLHVQRTSLTRALDWATMVDFVDATAEFSFRPDRDCLDSGFSTAFRGVDCVMWPNGPIDRGLPLVDWLPALGQPDLDFTIRTEAPTIEVGPVVYVSSEGVNAAWCPNLGPDYWRRLIDELGDASGQKPVLIGKHWDRTFADSVKGSVVDLIGQTTLPQVAGILDRARVVVGVISGMTILGNHFRTPTVAIHPIVPMNPRAWVHHEAPYATVPAPMAPEPGALAKIAMSIARDTITNAEEVPA